MAGAGLGIYGLNFSGTLGAIAAGRLGIRTDLSGEDREVGAMWTAGLGQTDREGIGENDTAKTPLRMGLVKEFEQRVGGHLFPNMRVARETLRAMLAEVADYVTVRTGAPLQYVERDGMTGRCLAYTSGGVRKAYGNVVDDTDALILARKLGCQTNIGRDHFRSSGVYTSGVRPWTTSGALGIDPITGERLPNVTPAPNQRVGDGDRRVMGRGMRTIMTQSNGKTEFANLVIPGELSPRFFDADLNMAEDRKYKTIPASIGRNLLPNDGYEEHDANNGGQVRIGMNTFMFFVDWEVSDSLGRFSLRDRYIILKASFLKTITTDSEWARRVPELVADTKTWGLVPGMFPNSIVPGMSPNVYERTGYRLRARTMLDFWDVMLPEKDSCLEPVHVGGYPHVDSHMVQRVVLPDGTIAMEGGGGLTVQVDGANLESDAAMFQMPMGALQAMRSDCPNLLVTRGFGGDQLGHITGRIELFYGKNGDVAGTMGALAELQGIDSIDLSYTKSVAPQLRSRGFFFHVPAVRV